MTYHVITLPGAEEEIVEAAAWISRQTDTDTAADWIAGLQTAMASLAQLPFRCPLAPENDRFEREIRQLLHGRGRQQYRILYTVQGEAVFILHVRHATRSYLDSER